MTELRAQMRPSEEADQTQLRLARGQGETIGLALQEMNEESASGIHAALAGDFEIAVAVEEAEGTWRLQDGHLRWDDPEEENCHVEVAVRDSSDGRFVPGLDVTVTLVDPSGNALGPHRQPFLWHPWLYHYGRNWTVAEAGKYRVHVRIGAPDFPRHDHVNGYRYLDPAEVEFEDVQIEPGRKRLDS